jgi:hypothetical protein
MDLQFITKNVLADLGYSDDGTPINISIYFEDLNQKEKIFFHLNKEDIYYHPASFIKLFNAYLASHNLAVDNLDTKSSADLFNAIHESLLVSDNDALSLLVDYNTDTQSGLRLSEADFQVFTKKRKKITEFFCAKNYSKGLKLHAKCFTYSPYGRDDQLVLDHHFGTNLASIEDIAKIMKDIRQDFPGLYCSLKRHINDQTDIQTEFIANGLNTFSTLLQGFYSKAAWNSRVRHDAALIQFSNNIEFLLIIMTKGLSEYKELIPSLTKSIFYCQTI